MQAEDIALLKRCEGRILAIERTTGEQFFAEVIVVVDEPPTPDVFLLPVIRQPDGTFTAQSQTGESVLLSEISRIALIPASPTPKPDPPPPPSLNLPWNRPPFPRLQTGEESAYVNQMRMTVLASGSKGNSTIIASARTRILVDAGLSCRELLRRMALAGEEPGRLDAILITHEHLDHVAGLAVLARRLGIPVYFTEPTHRAWVRMLTPRTTMSYAKWLDMMAAEKQARAEAVAARVPTYAPPSAFESIAAVSAEAASLDESLNRSADVNAGMELPLEEDCDNASPQSVRQDPTYLPSVEYFKAGHRFSVGDVEVSPFTIPHDAADPCGFVFESEGIRMALATDLGYVPPNVKSALSNVDVLFLESNHDIEMLRDGPYPWSVKQRVLSRVGHLSNEATAEFLQRDYDGGAAYIVLGHLSESNNAPELARITAERAIGDRLSLLGNKVLLALQAEPLPAINL